MKNSLATKAKRAVELATEKGSSNWLTAIPLNLNKKEFIYAIKLRNDWEITDTPMICACGVQPGSRNGVSARQVHYPAP